MGLFLDYENTDFWARMLTDFTDFLYNFLLEVIGFPLTLGFASCIQDSTDLGQKVVIPLRDASGNNTVNVGILDLAGEPAVDCALFGGVVYADGDGAAIIGCPGKGVIFVDYLLQCFFG